FRLIGGHRRSGRVAGGSARRGAGRGSCAYFLIHSDQRASFAVIHSATTSESFWPSRSTLVIIAPISSLSTVKALIAAWAPGHLSLTPDQPTFQIGPNGLPQS